VPEAPRFSLPARARARRSNAARAAETRARILDAVLESIAEGGFQRTTAAEITRRAGVTWGAVQHHFGDKDGALIAVVEASFEAFAASLREIPVDGVGLAKRASLFVDRAWLHFSSSLYRSTFEILLNFSGRDDLPETPSWQSELFVAWDQLWMQIFHDSQLPRRRQLVLQHYTVSVLSGLASTLVLEGAQAAVRPGELDLLRDTLVRELAGRVATPGAGV
jgi:AcrR family transcriptional regulator